MVVLAVAGCGGQGAATDGSGQDSSVTDDSAIDDSVTDDASLDAATDGGSDAPIEGGSDVAQESDACVAVSCTSKGATCGSLDDGCGKTLDCGSCTAPEKCVANVCALGTATLTKSWTISDPFATSTLAWITAIAYRPDGSRIAVAGGKVGSLGGTLVVVDALAVTVDASTGAAGPVLSLPPQHPVAAAFTPDGTTLAIGATTGDGTYVYKVDAAGALTASSLHYVGDSGGDFGVAISPDGTRIAAATTDSVCLFQTATAARSYQKEAAAPVLDVAFSATGNSLFAGLYPTSVGVLDATSLALVRTIAITSGAGKTLSHLASIPATTKAYATVGDAVYVVDATSSSPSFRFATGSVITSIAPNPKLAKVATAHADGSVRVWDVKTKTMDVSVTDGDAVDTIAWSPDGTKLAAGGKRTLIVWSLAVK